MKRFGYIFLLHIVLVVFSLLGILSKVAANESFLSVKFILYYCMILGELFIYALVWQQLLKKLPLVTVYANKAVTIIWGIIWGYLFFNETITVNKIIGAGIIIIGVYLVVSADYNIGEYGE